MRAVRYNDFAAQPATAQKRLKGDGRFLAGGVAFAHYPYPSPFPRVRSDRAAGVRDSAGETAISAILPLQLLPNAPPDLATAYWRCLCFAAGYLPDNAATLRQLATLVGATSVQTVAIGVPLPNLVYLLNFAAGTNVMVNGTTNPAQFVFQANGALLVIDPWGDGLVNSFDLLSAGVISSVIAPLLAIIAPPSVLYSGHSLGGAVAQLLCQRPQPYPVLGAWSAGQPRVGTALWAQNFIFASERYTTSGDPVPCIPPAFSPLVDSTLQPLWPFPLLSYQHAGRRRHVLMDGTITSPAETPSWQEGMEYLLQVQLGDTGWYGAHSPATYAARIRQGIPVPWLGSDSAWPLIGQLDALAGPLLGRQGGVPSPEQFTTAAAQGPVIGQYATQGICT